MKAKEFEELLRALKEKFKRELPLIEDSAEKICIVGDVHGDAETVDYVRKISKRFERIVWLGDYVDRGAHDIKVVTSVAKLDTKNVILAGNHDAFKEVWPRDFDSKLERCFGHSAQELEELYVSAFQLAPVAYFNGRYGLLALHGFIPSAADAWDFKNWKKVKDGGGITFQILWNDPIETAIGIRGEGIEIISSTTTENFFRRTGIKVIVRSHQPRINKIFDLKGGKIVNVGSSYVYGTRAIFILPEFEFEYF